MMRTRREYTKEFKEELVRLAAERGNIAGVAREFDIHPSVIRRWKKQLADHGDHAFPGKGHPQDEELAQLKRELRRVKEENAILKKAVGIFSPPPIMRYPYIEAHRAHFTVAAMCRVMGVSPSGYYSWRSRKPSLRMQQDMRLSDKIERIFNKSGQTYGSHRIQKALRSNGIRWVTAL